MDKYKNYRPQNMKLVAESLNQFALFENMEEAKKVFSNMGYDQNSPEWQDFEEAFDVNPGLAGKYAKWIEKSSDGEEEEFVKELMDTIERINQFKQYEIPLEELEQFVSFNSFKRHSRSLLQKKRESLHKKELEDIERKREEELSKKEGEYFDKIEKGEEVEKAIKDPNIIIDRLNLVPAFESKNRGLYVTQDVKNNPDLSKRGQGLYIWTDLPYLYDWDGNPNTLKINFKFGQYGARAGKKNPEEALEQIDNEEIIGKIPGETVAGYSGIYMSPKVILYAKNLDDFLSNPDSKFKDAIDVEKTIGDNLRKGKWSQPGNLKSTEVFRGGTLEELEQEINKVISGTTKTSFKPHPEQKTAIDKITKYFLEGNDNKEFLLAAKMRYGKNVTVLDTIKTLNEHSDDYKNCLVITYKPAVFSSLKDDVEKFAEFNNFEVIDINKVKNIPLTSDKVRIFVSSAQYALYGSDDKDVDINEGKKSDEELLKLTPEEEADQLQKTAYDDFLKKKNIEKLKSIHFGLIMADEYHYGTKSAKFQHLLSELDYDKIIYVSGTAMKDMATGKFNNDQIYNWTYIEEQKKRKKELKEKEKNPDGYYPHIDMPKMHFYKMELSPEAKRLAIDRGLYTEDQGFSFTKFIDTNEKTGKLENEELAKILVSQIIGNNPLFSIHASGVQGTSLDHTFWVMAKKTAGIKALAKVMEGMPEFKNKYVIIPATGDLNGNIDKVKNKIKEAENSGKKSITMSCYRFKEGTTVPEWGGVVMLDDGHSAEEYLQAIFRCQSPGRKGGPPKENCYVFDYNPQRLLSIYHDIAQWSSAKGKEGQFDMVKQFLNYAPILQSDGNKMVEVSADEVIHHFQMYGKFSEKMANERVFNFEFAKGLMDEDIINDLSDISPERNAKNIELNNQGTKAGKNANIEITRKEGIEDEDEELIKGLSLESQREKVRNILRRLPTFLFTSEEDEKTIWDVIDTDEEELFEEICGISTNVLKKLVHRRIINGNVLNETIEYFSEAIKEFEKNPTMESAEDFIDRHLIMKGKESSTPKEMVDLMLDKLPSTIWTNKNKTFCDPVCGTGKFLVGIYSRLMEGLKDKIPNKEDREKWIIEKMIVGVDEETYKTIMAKKLLGNKSYNYRIFNEDSLTKNWNKMPEFDVVVGNPPYQQGLHLKFLKLAQQISKHYVVFVEPAFWILTQKDTAAGRKNKNYFNNTLTEFELINGNYWFDALFFAPSGIFLLDKKKTGDEIKVINNLTKKEYIVDNIYNINIFDNDPNFVSIKNKIWEYTDKLQNHIFQDGKWYANVSKIRGHIESDEDNFTAEDYYTFIPDPDKATKEKSRQYVGFETEKEAQNFIDSLRTKFMRFALSIVKLHNNLQLNSGEFKYIPYMKDYTKKWGDKELYNFFNLTSEEIDYIESHIK